MGAADQDLPDIIHERGRRRSHADLRAGRRTSDRFEFVTMIVVADIAAPAGFGEPVIHVEPRVRKQLENPLDILLRHGSGVDDDVFESAGMLCEQIRKLVDDDLESARRARKAGDPLAGNRSQDPGNVLQPLLEEQGPTQGPVDMGVRQPEKMSEGERGQFPIAFVDPRPTRDGPDRMLEIVVGQTDSLGNSRRTAGVHDQRLRVLDGAQAVHRHLRNSIQLRRENDQTGDVAILRPFPGRNPQGHLAVVLDVFEVRGAGAMVDDQQCAVQEEGAEVGTEIVDGVRKREDDPISGTRTPGS